MLTCLAQLLFSLIYFPRSKNKQTSCKARALNAILMFNTLNGNISKPNQGLESGLLF